MAGPIRISVLANASRARSELAGTQSDLRDLGQAGDRASTQLRSSLSQAGSVFARLRQEAESNLDRIPRDAAGAIDKTSAEFQSLSPEMRRAVQDAARVASNELRAGAFGQAGEQAGEDAGEGFESSLTSKVKSAGPALAGAFAALGVGALFADALDQDAGTDRLAASLGATPREAQGYGRLAGKLYAEAFGENVGDIRTAIGAVQGNFRNLDGGALEDVTRRALTFADVFEVDVARASQVAGQAVRTGLAKNATEAFDLLTAASQKVPPSLREDVLDAADEYGGFFKQIGYDGEQAFSVLARGAGKGMYGIDKAGDAVKEFGILVSTDLGRTQPVIEGLGLDYERMADSLLAGGPKARRATNDIIDGLLSIESPSERARQAVALFGTPLEDLGTNQIPGFLRSLKSAKGGLGDFEGATDRAGKTAYDNAQNQFKAFGRGLKQDVVEAIVDALPEIRATARELEETFGPALRVAGGFAADAARAFAKLPDPVKALAGGAALAAFVVPKMAGALGGMAGGLPLLVSNLRNTETRAAATRTALTRMGGAAKFAAGAGGLALLVASSDETSGKMRALEKAAGGALLGFAVGGPIGGAIGGAAGGMQELATNTSTTAQTARQVAENFPLANGVLKTFAAVSGDAAGATKQADDASKDYAATLNQTTGAISRQTRAQVLAKLEQEDLIGAGRNLGLNARDLISATLGNEAAQKKVNRAYRESSTVLDGLDLQRINKFIREQGLAFREGQSDVRQRNSDLSSYSQVLRGMPKSVKTRLETLNYDPTQRQLRNIINSTDNLTKREKRILIREFGSAGVSKRVRGLRRDLNNAGKARPNLGPWGLLLRRGVGQGERAARRGSNRINRDLRQTGRTNPFMNFWGGRVNRGVQQGQRNARRGTREVNRDLGRAGRVNPFIQFWNRSLAAGVNTGRRNATRGGRDVADQLSRGPSRAKPNLRNYTGAINRGVSDGVRTGRRGGSDVARGMTDPVNRARPNLSGYVGGVQSGVGQARSVGSSGGVGVGGALKSGIIAGFSGTASALAAQAASAVRGAISAARREAAIRSPSKKMTKVGQQLGDGLALGLNRSKKKGNSAARKLMLSVLAAAGNDLGSLKARLEAYGKASDRSEKRVRGVIKALAGQSKALIRARDAEQKLEARVKSASESLKAAIGVRDEYAKSVRDSVVQFGNVTSFEEGHLNSTDSFLTQLRERAAEAARFAAVVNDLKKRGLNATSLRQILEAGPEAGRAAAEAIAAGGAGAVKEVNDLTAQLGQTGKTLGDGMAAGFYNAGIRAKNKLLQGLEDKERTAEKRAGRLAQSLLKAFRKRLDIGGSGGGGKKGGGKGGKNRANAASLLLGDERSGQRQAEQYGRMLAQGVNTGYAAASKRTVSKPTSAKPAASVKAGAVAPMRVRVDITPNEALNAAAAGRTISKWVDAYQDSAIGGRRS